MMARNFLAVFSLLAFSAILALFAIFAFIAILALFALFAILPTCPRQKRRLACSDTCPGGGIGRRSGLKIRRASALTSSSLVLGI